MTNLQILRNRINFQSDFDELLIDVSKDYGIGEYISFVPVELGYEDVNLKLTTSAGNFFVKIFAEKRDDQECLRLINIVKSAIDKGVPHPVFLHKPSGYIFRGRYDDFNVRLAVFEYIEGKSYFEIKRNPSTSELKEIIKYASLIHEIDYKPPPLYDRWALVNFPAELEKAKKYLDAKDLKVMDKLLEEFEKIDMSTLSYSLVHGDLISTNIMKTKDKIYFVDFSVANYYPRIVELAVLMSDVMFDPKGATSIEKYYKLLTGEYQKYHKLTKEELAALPLFIKLSHAMHLIGGVIQKEKLKNKSEENEHWLKLGKKGLELTQKVFK